MKNLSEIIKNQSQTNPKFAQCTVKLKKLLQKCQSQSKIQPVMVIDRIFIGNISAATNSSFLEQNNIKLIISCLQIQLTHKFNHISYHQVPIKDRENQPISQYFQKVQKWIQNQPGNILIHCWGGKSRSVAIALSYMLRIKCKQYSFQEIYQQLKIQYPLSKINSYFQKQLKQYYNKIRVSQEIIQQNLRQVQSKALQANQEKNNQNHDLVGYVQIVQDQQNEPQKVQSNSNENNQKKIYTANNDSLLDFDTKKQEISLLDEQLKNNAQQQFMQFQKNVDLLDINQHQHVSNSNQNKKQVQNQKNLIDFQDTSTVYSQNSHIQDVRFQQKLQQNIHITQNGQQQQQTGIKQKQQESKQQNQQQLCGSGELRKKKKKKKNK